MNHYPRYVGQRSPCSKFIIQTHQCNQTIAVPEPLRWSRIIVLFIQSSVLEWLNIASSCGGSRPLSNVVFWAHLSPQPKGHLDWFSRFCKDHDHDRQVVKVNWQKAASLPYVNGIPYTLHWATPFFLKLPLPVGDLNLHLIWFLGPTWVHNPKGISIGSAGFARITIMTDRQTDWLTDLLCNNRPHLCT